MAFNGNVPKEEIARLKELWEKSGHNRDKFKISVEGDKDLIKKRSWNSWTSVARRLGFYSNSDLSHRYWGHNLAKNNPEATKRLDLLLADKTTQMTAILEEYKPHGVKSILQLRNYAKSKSIKIRKGKPKPEKIKVYEKRVAEFFEDGSFVRLGLPKVIEILRREFPNRAKLITKKEVYKRLEVIVWTDTRSKAHREAVMRNLVDSFIESNPNIPVKMITRRTRFLKGVISADQFMASATLLKGIGRLSVEGTTKKDEQFEFPDSSFSQPFSVEVKNKENWTCDVLNGTNFGTLYNPLIEENPLRAALANAERSNVDCVFITNLLNVEFRKAVGSELHILKAFFSGHNVNSNLLNPSYRDVAERILKTSPDDEAVYELAAEMIINVMSGLHKVANKPLRLGDDNSPKIPEYNGKVYIVFGYNEESLIANLAYWELRLIALILIDRYKAQRSFVNVAIREIEKRLNWPGRLAESSMEKALFRRDEGAQDIVGDSQLTTKLQQLRKKAEELNDAINRTRITLTSREDRVRYTKRLRAKVVAKIEEAIPHSKVIGQGTVNVKIGNKVVQLYIPRHMRVTEGHLDAYAKQYGALSREQLVPETVIICHPYSINYRMVCREINLDHKRGEAKLYTAPMLVDGSYLRSQLRDAVREAHPIVKAVNRIAYSPGILRVGCVNGILNADCVSLDVLMKNAAETKISKTKVKVDRIWIMVMTDPHFGAADREEVWSRATRGSFGVADAVIQMMREGKILENGKSRIHMTTTNDDIVNAHHFDNHKQPDPRAIPYQDKERIAREMVASGKSPDEIVRFFLEQDRLRGTYWLQDQIQQVKDRHIKPNLDFWQSVIQRNIKSGLKITPTSEIHKLESRFDRRDLGAINWGTGNHMESEIDRSLTEGFIYRDYLRALLYGSFQGKVSEDLIKKLVVAPIEGNQYFAWGYVGIPGEYEWAIEFRSDPPRLSSWGDVLSAAVSNDAMRGDYGLYMTGHKTLKVYGDKHFFAAVDTKGVFYHMCAAGTHTNLYGHRGFPPNNTGISFVGLPVGGPSAGPILVRPIHIQHIVSYFEKPFDFDWESFLPDPV